MPKKLNRPSANDAIRVLGVTFAALLGADSVDAETLEDKTTVLFRPYAQWELRHHAGESNPFDVEAVATFTHKASGEKRTTGIFYTGKKTWTFRFTGTRTRRWTFETNGPGNLGGHRGSVTVEPNPDPAVRGFIGAHEGRFVRQGPGEEEREAFIPNVWMNYRRWGHSARAGWTDIDSTFGSADTVEAYLDDAQAHGCNGIHALICNSWFKKDVPTHRGHDSENPDRATFRALERAIVQAHRRGMFIHIWAWGDEARGWTPVGVGGVNGDSDRRLQRYIAARLGPLPGWTMQYGFDLNEWVEPGQVRAWAENLRQHMGWDHLLGARETDDNNGFDAPDDLSYLAHDARPTRDFYSIAADLLEHAGGRPVLLERRFTWRRDSVWDMPTTQQAMWQFAMAGGVGAIWGYYPPGSSPHQPGHYDAALMRTHRTFWRPRFRLGMRRADGVSEDARVLRGGGSEHYVVYQQNTETIVVDLSQMNGPQPVVAVDAAEPYEEIDLGAIEPGRHTIKLSRRTDWAIAVGTFE